MIIFEIESIEGKIVYLTKERWDHIVQRHAELSNGIEDIKATLLRPLLIETDKFDPHVKTYYRYYKNATENAKYLSVIIRYLNGNGFVITSFYTNRINGGK